MLVGGPPRCRSGSRDLTAAPSSATGVESVPLWIGSADRPLFAWLDVPSDGLVAGAAVICPSMGLEAAYSARTLRTLAHRLAEERWAALRLDYAATGDSVGSWTDADLVDEWLGNIRFATDALRAYGAPRVGVVGLRLGATLAAAELGHGGPVDDLVLWDPCPAGRSFLREQRALFAFRRQSAVEWGTATMEEVRRPPAATDEGFVEAPGAVFSAATAAALEPLVVAGRDRTLATRELVLHRRDKRVGRVLEERLELPHVESSAVDGQDALFGEEPETPMPTLDRIVSWLSEAGGTVGPLTVPEHPRAAVIRAPGRPEVRERAVTIGPARLFGMLSEPEEDIDPSAPTVVFLNVGLIGHQGPGRLWVELARAAAAAGSTRSLRVDLSGIGDSPARPGRAEMSSFPVDALQDMDDIRRAASADGAPLIVIGVCSGADHAMEMALAAPVASICVINPALSYVQWGEDQDATPTDEGPGDDRVTWGETGPLLSRALARLERFKGYTRWVPTPGWWVVKRWLLTSSPVRTMEHLVQSGVDVLVVVGSGEARRIYRGEQRRLHALVARGGVHVEAIAELDHSLLERTSHDRVAELFGAYVARRAAELSPAATSRDRP
jgi:hypothetical protein